jgi:hypothetical protein
VGISPGNDVGRSVEISIGLIKHEKVSVKTDQTAAWVQGIGPLYRCYLRVHNKIRGKSYNPIVLRQICL